MNKVIANLLAVFAVLMLLCNSAFGQKVYVLELWDEIHPASARYMSKGMAAAQEANAELIIVHMNTYGGMVQYADSIRSQLLDSEIPTAVFIDKNAASAGALISLACDSIYMAPGSSIGAATVVEGETGEVAPDKYQSYFRGIMRATAEENGRDPKIAEKMVDQNLELPGISPKGQVITFTPSEAMEHGYADGIKKSIEEVLEVYGYEDAEVIVHESEVVDKIIEFLINPAVSGIVIMMIFGGIFFELKAPGLGFPSVIALVGIALFFAPHYMEGLASSWEIVIFMIGLVLIALEIFVVPGFGVTGISGIILTVTGLAAAIVRNDGFDFTYVSSAEILQSFAIILVSMATSILLVIWIAKQFVTEKHAFPFVDTDTQDKEKGYTALNKEILEYVGRDAVALTDLKPAGYVEIDGKRLDAETEGNFVEQGTKVKVLRVRSINLIVRKA